MNGHILLSVYGFATTSYLLASMASEAAIGQGHVVQLGPRWHTRSGRVDQRWSGAPERACETDAALGLSSGHGPGVLAR